MRQSSPKEIADMFKSLVRPFLIVSGWITWLSMIATQADTPEVLTGIVAAITLEYFGERAYKRFKEKN